MEKDTALKVMEAIEGVPRYEWEKIVRAVNRKYEEASSRVRFTQEDAQDAMVLIDLDYGFNP